MPSFIIARYVSQILGRGGLFIPTLPPQKTADLVTFTEEILNGKFHFFCSVRSVGTSLSIFCLHRFFLTLRPQQFRATAKSAVCVILFSNLFLLENLMLIYISLSLMELMVYKFTDSSIIS